MHNQSGAPDWILTWGWTMFCYALLAFLPTLPSTWRATIVTLICLAAGSLWVMLAVLTKHRHRW